MNVSLKLFSSEYVELAWRFRVSSFSCDNPEHYSNYIKFSAIQDGKAGMGLTHALIDSLEDGTRNLAGYVSLRATSLITVDQDGKYLVNPALEIAELAVDENYERAGIGTELINISLAIADRLRHESLGIKYVLVCADPCAVGFYQKQGFASVGASYNVLYDGWNNNCEPMYIRLPEI